MSAVRVIETDETADEAEVHMERMDADEVFRGIESREVIGVEELAAAILVPRYDSWVDSHFWGEYVRLVRERFGLTRERHSEVEWLDRAIEAVRVDIVPLCGGLEVPRVVGQAFHSLPDVGQVRTSVRSLQWRFFVELILAIAPGLRERTTTLSELRALGLTGPVAIDYDNF